MNIVDRVFGRKLDLPTERLDGVTREDGAAVARYERLVASSSSRTIQRVHVEAFEKLTPAQLDLLFERFTAEATPGGDAPADARPKSLAKAAARLEKRRPGAIRRILANSDDPLVAAVVGYSILDTIADIAVTSALWATFDDGAGFGGWLDEGDWW
ncbi:hypothetical protein [Leifsonia shinshuensis]|uniref:Uncharacterized protein n=1 Tax=Leifsonia shinshuensis TaxID=150026 RepID=A0A853D3F4_9MICO|nr:hypothetical protein [Leifsonia shinshuensis]NYJ25961.1 hypothetical protein [Leifsonia shinshuensis]